MSETAKVWSQDVERIQPLHDWMVCKVVEETFRSKGGILLAEPLETVVITADVISVGRGCWVKTKNGWAFAETVVQPGDRVVLPRFAIEEVNEAGSDFVMIREQQVLGVVKP